MKKLHTLAFQIKSIFKGSVLSKCFKGHVIFKYLHDIYSIDTYCGLSYTLRIKIHTRYVFSSVSLLGFPGWGVESPTCYDLGNEDRSDCLPFISLLTPLLLHSSMGKACYQYLRYQNGKTQGKDLHPLCSLDPSPA